jgi:hypothetical protein
MPLRFLLLICITAMIDPAKGRATGPDDPAARLPDARYGSVTTGTRSYRPVEPLPWDQINRRVMPKDAQPPDDKAQSVPRDGQGEPGPPQHAR